MMQYVYKCIWLKVNICRQEYSGVHEYSLSNQHTENNLDMGLFPVAFPFQPLHWYAMWHARLSIHLVFQRHRLFTVCDNKILGLFAEKQLSISPVQSADAGCGKFHLRPHLPGRRQYLLIILKLVAPESLLYLIAHLYSI